MVRGELYDKHNAPLRQPLRTSGLQPSLPHFALAAEIGWSPHPHWAFVAKPRIDVINVSWAATAVGRYRHRLGARFGFHADLGGGYGQILSPVQPKSAEEIYLDRTGSALVTAGLGVTWQFSRQFAAVVGVDAHMGLPEMGVVFDIGSIGIRGHL